MNDTHEAATPAGKLRDSLDHMNDTNEAPTPAGELHDSLDHMSNTNESSTSAVELHDPLVHMNNINEAAMPDGELRDLLDHNTDDVALTTTGASGDIPGPMDGANEAVTSAVEFHDPLVHMNDNNEVTVTAVGASGDTPGHMNETNDVALTATGASGDIAGPVDGNKAAGRRTVRTVSEFLDKPDDINEGAPPAKKRAARRRKQQVPEPMNDNNEGATPPGGFRDPLDHMNDNDDASDHMSDNNEVAVIAAAAPGDIPAQMDGTNEEAGRRAVQAVPEFLGDAHDINEARQAKKAAAKKKGKQKQMLRTPPKQPVRKPDRKKAHERASNLALIQQMKKADKMEKRGDKMEQVKQMTHSYICDSTNIQKLDSKAIAIVNCLVNRGESPKFLMSLLDNTVRMSDAATFEQVDCIGDGRSGSPAELVFSSPAELVFSTKPGLLLTGGCDGRFALSILKTHLTVAEFQAHDGPIFCMDAWLGFIVSVGRDNVVRLCRLAENAINSTGLTVELEYKPLSVHIVRWYGDVYVVVVDADPRILSFYTISDMRFSHSFVVPPKSGDEGRHCRLVDVLFNVKRDYCGIAMRCENSKHCKPSLRVVAGVFDKTLPEEKNNFDIPVTGKSATSQPTFSWNLTGTGLWLTGLDQSVCRLNLTGKGNKIDVMAIGTASSVHVCSSDEESETILTPMGSGRGTRMKLSKYKFTLVPVGEEKLTTPKAKAVE